MIKINKVKNPRRKEYEDSHSKKERVKYFIEELLPIIKEEHKVEPHRYNMFKIISSKGRVMDYYPGAKKALCHSDNVRQWIDLDIPELIILLKL